VSVLKNRHLLDWGRLSSRTAAYRTLTPAAYTVKFVFQAEHNYSLS
jgi:hypothetical protein